MKNIRELIKRTTNMLNKKHMFWSTSIVLCFGMYMVLRYDIISTLPSFQHRITLTDTTLDRSVFSNRNINNKNSESKYSSDVGCGSVDSMTSAKFSKLRLDSIDDAKITITVMAHYPNKTYKAKGGDVIVVRAVQTYGKGLASGKVTDNLNGSYTGTIPLAWNGYTRIFAKILSSSENTCLRLKSLEKYKNVVFSMQKPEGINGIFKSTVSSVKTRCQPTADIYGYQNICNFTTLNDNVPWYCGSPVDSNLSCKNIYSFGTGPFHIPNVKADQKIRYAGHAILDHNLIVNVTNYELKIPTTPCHEVQKNKTWTRHFSSGFFNGTWRPAFCTGLRDYSFQKYRQCLNGKTVVFLGDSTVRQYYEYMCKQVVKGKCYTQYRDFGPNRSFHSEWVLKKSNITLLFRKHELPFYNPDAFPNKIKSLPTILKELANGVVPDQSLIVVVNYLSHFSSFPANVFRSRISNLVKALKYLLIKKPKVTILFKGAHVAIHKTRWFDAKISLYFRDIVFEEFHDIMNDVIYLDTWDITVTHNSENIHPSGQCMQSQIEQFMSLICYQ